MANTCVCVALLFFYVEVLVRCVRLCTRRGKEGGVRSVFVLLVLGFGQPGQPVVDLKRAGMLRGLLRLTWDCKPISLQSFNINTSHSYLKQRLSLAGVGVVDVLLPLQERPLLEDVELVEVDKVPEEEALGKSFLVAEDLLI